MKIGITEQGDPSLDSSWIPKLDKVDGAIIISKGFSKLMDDTLLKHSKRLILHQVITGFGGTSMEPHVPHPEQVMDHLVKLVKRGFPIDHVVIRIDPILPSRYVSGLLGPGYHYLFRTLLDNFAIPNGFFRVRYSYCDFYPHVKQRFEAKFGGHVMTGKGIPLGTTLEARDRMEIQRELFRRPQIKFEACCEEFAPKSHQVGCISELDLQLMGLEIPTESETKWKQRPNCLCKFNKTELLNCKHPCYHNCLYCYWKTEEEINPPVVELPV